MSRRSSNSPSRNTFLWAYFVPSCIQIGRINVDCMGKASFTPLCMAFTALASTKLSTAQRDGVEISYTEFHPNRSRNMHNRRWKFIDIPKYDASLVYCNERKYQISWKLDRRFSLHIVHPSNPQPPVKQRTRSPYRTSEFVKNAENIMIHDVNMNVKLFKTCHGMKDVFLDASCSTLMSWN